MVVKFSLFIATFLFLLGCASHHSLIGDQAYQKISPVKNLQLDPFLAENLIIKVHNVADAGPSFKNRFELFVNGQRIEPITEVTNTQRNYEYRLKLRPGYYDVKGIYFWYDGWSERKTEVRTEDLVRVETSRRTILEKTIQKNWDGTPVERTMYFEIKFQPFETATVSPSIERTVDERGKSETEKADLEMEKGKARVTIESPPAPEIPGKILARRQLVMLQINTDPQHCDVIVDDEMVGQSPVSVWIDPSTNHVVQISHPDYQTAIRFMDSEKLLGREKMILIQRLEPKK